MQNLMSKDIYSKSIFRVHAGFVQHFNASRVHQLYAHHLRTWRLRCQCSRLNIDSVGGSAVRRTRCRCGVLLRSGGGGVLRSGGVLLRRRVRLARHLTDGGRTAEQNVAAASDWWRRRLVRVRLGRGSVLLLRRRWSVRWWRRSVAGGGTGEVDANGRGDEEEGNAQLVHGDWLGVRLRWCDDGSQN